MMSDEKKQPLSPEGWIKLYTDEINKVDNKLTIYWNVFVVVLIAFLGAEVAFLVGGLQSDKVIPYLLVVVMFISLFLSWVIYKKYYEPPIQSRLKSLINAREAIISGKRADYEEIQSEWKVYMEEYYGKYLEKSEMTKEEKESRDQKGDPQVPQSDIMLIKESLQEVKDMLERTNVFSVLVTLGSFLIAISIFMISLCTTLLLSKDYYAGSIVLIIGTLILISGGLMISSAEPYIGALKGRLHDNFPFRLATYVLGIAILILYLSILVVKFFF